MIRSLACVAAVALCLTGCGPSQPSDETAPAGAPSHDAAKPAPEKPDGSMPDETRSEAAVLDDWLPWPVDREGIEITDSGLRYVMLEPGRTDAAPPTPRDEVRVMYEGRLARNGETFDSAYERGQSATFPLNRVIPGWTEGLQLMHPGAKAIFNIPADLAYGDSPPPGSQIRAGDDLVFLVELEEVMRAPPKRAVDAKAWETYTPWDSDLEAVQETGTGLEYVVLEEGAEGNPSPGPDDTAVVYYEGRLDETGDVFDSAFDRGRPQLLRPRDVITGWRQALSMMSRGDRWLVHIPAELGYGEAGKGPVPPGAALNFEIELRDVLPADEEK